ncbi:MAG TPA: ImcF-related family protein [Candidatus Angelobacter sp.]|nr:ImcF-related family protein [Candidatus Angelobacter sp.]
MTYFIAAIILVFFLIMAWVTGSLLQLHGASLWILRCGLALIGVAAAGWFLWFQQRLKRQQQFGAPAESAGNTDAITVLVRQAEQKLRASNRPGNLGSYPIVFVLGETGSAKTSTILHTGVDPELLAGHVFHESDIVPTGAINIWFARNTLFIEAGGKLASDAGMWSLLLRHTRPARLSAAMGKGGQAARAALVCMDCERLTSANAQNSAQQLAARLKEMAQSLAATFPVYVLFTKLDRVPYFAEFVSNLSSHETAQILGATLPRMKSDGVFEQEESNRLSRMLDQIIYSLSEKRLDYLRRESVAEKLPGIYEFPRELRKIRNSVIQFLVNLTRPTQLSTNPFLRGFYFSGVRAIIVNEAVLPPAAARTAAAGSGATRILNFGEFSEPAPSAPARSMQSRKVPEWAFLPNLFSEIVLRDRAAFSSGHRSTKVDLLRRIFLSVAAALCLFFSIAFLISFFNNRALELDVQKSASRLAASTGPVDLPDMDQLKQLDQLRNTLAALTDYQDGAPFRYRFGLYAGESLYRVTRNIYFSHFYRLLLASTQTRIATRLKGLPESPAASADDFGDNYKSLKAYLMTTRNPDRADKNFLSPILLDRWSNGQGIDPTRLELARNQFDFYSGELQRSVPVSPRIDGDAIDHARQYLKLGGIQSIYQRLLAEAGRNNQSVVFSKMYPNTVVVNSYEVPAAFTKDGFKAAQEALKNPEKFFGGEEWVLGNQGGPAPPPDKDKLREQLQALYIADFAKHWRAYMKASKVVDYSNIPDAANKLTILSGNASPLLQLFSLAARNTNVDSPAIAAEFQPLQLMAPSPDQLVGGANQPYMANLVALQTNTAGLASQNNPTDPAATQPVLQAATTAKGTVLQISQTFHHVENDAQVDKLVRSLMEAPILSTEALMRGVAPNGKGVCSLFQGIARKYPFSPKSTEEATLEDLKFFQPGSGALWAFYDASLKNILLRQGTEFVPNSQVRISHDFLVFLHRAAVITDALFPPGTQNAAPHLSFTLRQPANKGIDKLTLDLDGKTLSGSGGNSQQFVWPGDATHGARLTVSHSGGSQFLFPPYPGLWGTFHFFQDARRWTPKGSAYELEWPLEYNNKQITLPDGTTPIVVRYEIEGSGAQFFRSLEGLRCTSVGTH